MNCKSFFLKPYQSWIVSCRFRKIYRRKAIASFTTEEDYEKSLSKVKKVKTVSKVTPVKQPHIDIENQLHKFQNLKYKRSSGETDHMFSKMMKNMKTKKYQEFNLVCLLQGEFLINKAIKAGCYMRTIYFTDMSLLKKLPLDILRKCNLISISKKYLNVLDEKSSKEGLFAVISQQDAKTREKIIKMRSTMISKQEQASLLPITVICNGINDPNQLGDILKISSFTGCHQVFVTEDCCNIWNKTVVETSGGAHFSIPVVNELTWERLEKLFQINKPGKVFIAHEECTDLNQFKVSDKNEKVGISPQLLESFKKEISLENSDGDLGSLVIPSIMYDQIRLVQNKSNNILICGKPSEESFEFAANMQKLGSEVFVLDIPKITENSIVPLSLLANVLLIEARRQRNRLDEMRNTVSEKTMP